MENQEILDNQQHQANSTIEFDTLDALGNLATWMKYASIVGIIGAVVSAIFNIVSKKYEQIPVSIITAVFPIILLNIAAMLERFHRDDNPHDFTRFALSIKQYFVALGIIVIVLIGIFILVFLGMLIYGLTR